MLVEFFLENARIELTQDGLRYRGSVPDLPEIEVEAASPDECRIKLAEAIAHLLTSEATRPISKDPISKAPMPKGSISKAGAAQTRIAEILSQQPQGAKDDSAAAKQKAPGFTEILYEKRDWVARVTLNRPDVYNAYSSTTLREMAQAFGDARRDNSVAVLVLTGAGTRAFCAGSDVKQHSEDHLRRPDEFRKWMGSLIEAHEALRQIGKPTVARINGIVAGGGNEWNLACDLAIAADHAKFIHIETSVGIAPVSGAAQWLSLFVGERRAREILMTCEPISAGKALAWGLVNDVVPYEELDQKVDALCQRLIDRFPECMRYTRDKLSFWKDLVWNSTIDQARSWLADHFASPEISEGLSALAEQRPVDYRRFRLNLQSKATVAQEFDRVAVGAGRSCTACGAVNLPEKFKYCGECGAQL